MQRNKKGYIALTSVIIISIVLMGIVFAASLRGFQVRSSLTDYYLKTLSKRSAESCIEIAKLKLADTLNYPLYAGNETLSIGEDSCSLQTIEIVNEVPIKKILRSVSTVGKATTRLKVIIDALTLKTYSWEEVLSF